MDLFEQRHISPMLLYQTQPFDDEDYIFELKLDGVRCIAYLDNKLCNVILENKRFKDVAATYPELSEIYKCVRKRTILDGELVMLNNGKPDFFALQRRTLLSDVLRIELASKQNPVQYVAYDILYYDGDDLTDLPLIERKKILEENVRERANLSKSRFIEGAGTAFFELARKEQLEGIVAKKKDGRYHIGKRTRDWLKIKVLQDEDMLVCGYQPDGNGNVKDLILGSLEKNMPVEKNEYSDSLSELVCRGKVYLGISPEERKIILDFAERYPIVKPIFPQFKKAVWMEPRLVGTVQYMHKTVGGNLRQPIL